MACTDCGVSPTWPITGTPIATIEATVAATSAPPSSFTAAAPPSLRKRPALRRASSALTW